MRIVCSVAKSRDALDMQAAQGREAYVITDTMPKVSLRMSCAAGELEETAAFIRLADVLFDELIGGGERTLDQITMDTREKAKRAMDAHPEHLLYSQLAQSLLNWCDLTDAAAGSARAKNYASVMMYTICREWRMALLGN